MNFKKINCPVCGLIPKWLRFIIISIGLILFISYVGNSLKTEEFFSEDKNNQSSRKASNNKRQERYAEPNKESTCISPKGR